MYIGVDTHKRTHTLVVIDTHGRLGGTRTISNTPDGWTSGLEWIREWGGKHIWGIENSGSLGKAFAQFLLSQGEMTVCEVSPHRTAQYRRRGRTQDKTDQTDALAIARLLLAEGEQLPQVQRDDQSTGLRLLSDHWDNLLAERTRLINQLHAQMLQLDPSYRERSGPLTKPRGLAYCRAFRLPRYCHANV
jgi:transposase